MLEVVIDMVQNQGLGSSLLRWVEIRTTRPCQSLKFLSTPVGTPCHALELLSDELRVGLVSWYQAGALVSPETRNGTPDVNQHALHLHWK